MLLINQVPRSLFVLRSSLKLQSFSRCLSSMASKHVKAVIHHDNIIKSPQDKRQYRGLELNNGLKVMIISDPDTDKSAAAMDINIGSMSDPWELPGLAHFCEHMLFLGTKKYEQENEYNKFLNENGGSSNAYTSGEHTNFYFDVAPDSLAGALDRFAQFFLGPLFTPSATEREINAVNSENDKNLQSDPWRLHQLDRSLAKPDHDYIKFGTGNKDSLDTIPKSRGQDVREELLKFHSKYYSSNIMALSILGKESLDALTDLVAPLLADVINKNASVPEWTEHPYGPEQCKTICYALPVKDVRNLSLSWSIPDLHPYYASNPGHYLGHLVGHEGPGSLLSELKAKGWVNTLCGGQSNGAKGFMFFKVDVDLTEEGIEHVDDIVTLTYQYVNLLRKSGPQEWIFKECQDLSAMTFRFKDKEKPRNYVSGLSGSLHDYPETEALSGPYLLTEFRPDLINMILEKITPDNMRIGVIGKKFQERVNQKEKWYGTEYLVEELTEAKLQQWASCGLNDKLTLPARNEFIPTVFDLAPREVDPSPLPEMVKDGALTRLWFKQDDTFLLPKACINFEISSPLAYSDPTNCNMTNLFVTLFKDALNEYAYDAELAGLHYDLNCTIYGMSLAVGGYNEKQDVLLRKIMEKLTTFKVDPKRFAIFKEMYARSMRNFQAEQPHRHAIYYTNILMSEVKWTNEELMQALEDITDEKLQAFIPDLLSKLYLEGLIYGNFTKQKALEVTEMIEDILQKQSGTRSLLPSQKKHFRELQMPDGCYYVCEEKNQVHKSSSIEIYYQCGVQLTNTNMLLELFIQIIGEPCFDILRTKEQLGYIVFSGIRRTSGVQGMRIIVQSDRKPQYVENRVEAFLQSMDAYIKDMTEESFQKHVTALAAKRLEKPKKISGQQSRYWGEIVSQQFNFDRDDIEVAFLKGIKKNDVYSFYKDHICVGAPKRHKLSVHVMSTVEGAGTPDSQTSDSTPDSLASTPELPQPIIVRDIADFKRDMALFPLPKPYIDLQKARSKL
ncbi:insulin-degrading enzyme-like [Ylistrum balloti]|uniref:insulin-degrading enzyme-like n=1 Tax=Ylistrum balloti TaxID=509963 RepID=UPI002905A84E|nr:insulin-degrading enzyme-like [Ylistrum balloti]